MLTSNRPLRSRCVSRLPNLRALTLRHCLVVGTAPKAPIVPVFGSLTRLSSLSLDGVRTANDGLAHLLATVPPGLSAFSYNRPSLLHCPSHARLINAFLVEHRHSLTTLDLLESATCSQIGTLLAETGQFDGALAQLVNLRALAVGPAVFGASWAVLGALPRLRELEVVQGATRPLRRVEAGVVAEALSALGALRRVALPKAVVEEWLEAEWREVQATVEGRGARLIVG